jgi:hypothetical protein
LFAKKSRESAMSDGPAYVILGRGRWAERMRGILAGENRRAAQIGGVRQGASETATQYRERLATDLRATQAQIAWLCVLPGPHVAIMIDAALDAGLHVLAEKPWLADPQITDALAARAKALRRILAVHYEYCFLDEVQRWRKQFGSESGLSFSGHFFLSRPNHTGMTALDNLGTHLLAIRSYAVPLSTVQEIRCGYEQGDERRVWLDRAGERIASIDLLESKEPIIQRFLAQFEASLDGAHFPIDLQFAQHVADEIDALR